MPKHDDPRLRKDLTATRASRRGLLQSGLAVVALVGGAKGASAEDDDATRRARPQAGDRFVLLGEEKPMRSMASSRSLGSIPISSVPVTDWNAEREVFACPCHGSEYDPRRGAAVIFGPAPRPLAALPLRMADGNLQAAGGLYWPRGGNPERGMTLLAVSARLDHPIDE